MKLNDFIEKYICVNSVVRLWVPFKVGYKMIVSPYGQETCMEHEIINNKVWHSRFKGCEVIGITDIVCERSPEAINIVVKCNLD